MVAEAGLIVFLNSSKLQIPENVKHTQQKQNMKMLTKLYADSFRHSTTEKRGHFPSFPWKVYFWPLISTVLNFMVVCTQNFQDFKKSLWRVSLSLLTAY